MRKQKLSPEASKAKAIRDKKIAMTGHRRKRKNENERMGQRPDSDIHHTKDGKQVRVPIKDNRGNFGNGTKSEGPNMMGQTWLNKRIKGPNAEGDPVKKKKGGVKPYVTTNPNDPRIQAYSDSLSVHNQYQHKIQPDYKVISTSWDSKVAKQEYQKLATKRDAYSDYVYGKLTPSGRNAALEEINKSINKKYRPQLTKSEDSKRVEGGAYENTFNKMSAERASLSKPVYDKIKKRGAEVLEDEIAVKKRMAYLKSSHAKTKDNQINFDFDKPDSSFNVNGMKPVSWDKTVVEGNSYYTGKYNVVNNKYGKTFGTRVKGTGSDIKNPDSVTYSPKFKKPTQRVILREKIKKTPIGKLKSKSTTPNKLGNRQTVMGTSGKREPASMYQKRKGLTDNQMYRTFPGLDPNKAK